jgi:hypothetical protein
MNSKSAARQQYEETYRRLRTAKRASGLTIEEIKSPLRHAAYAATKSMFAKTFNRDMIEGFQIRLNNAKKRNRIRQSNKKIMATNFSYTF